MSVLLTIFLQIKKEFIKAITQNENIELSEEDIMDMEVEELNPEQDLTYNHK